MPWINWEVLFSMLCMLCMDKGSSLNVDLMISGNYVVITIMLMSIYVYICACKSLTDRDISDHDCFMNKCLYVYMYVCMLLYERVVRDHDCFRMMFICLYVYMYVCMSLSNRDIMNRYSG